MGDEREERVADAAADQEGAPRPARAEPDAAAEEWVEEEARLVNEKGLHAYPAQVVFKVASGFKSEILIRHGEVDVDAKGVVSLLTLSAPGGTRLMVRARGVDAKGAAAVVAAVLGSGFGEE